METKTNALRMLDKAKIPYQTYQYAADAMLSGADIARILKQNPAQVFKTLVTVAKSHRFYVFMIPVEAELDLKKAAASVTEKSVEMIKQKELQPLTGYVHGGCSPLGMKKTLTTVIHSSAQNFATIICSAGRVGMQVELSLSDLQKIIPVSIKDVTL